MENFLWTKAINFYNLQFVPTNVKCEGASFTEFPDIGTVAEDDLPVQLTNDKVAAATISTYNTCLACNSKTEPID